MTDSYMILCTIQVIALNALISMESLTNPSKLSMNYLLTAPDQPVPLFGWDYFVCISE